MNRWLLASGHFARVTHKAYWKQINTQLPKSPSLALVLVVKGHEVASGAVPALLIEDAHVFGAV